MIFVDDRLKPLIQFSEFERQRLSPKIATSSFEGLGLDLPPGLFDAPDAELVASVVRQSYKKLLGCGEGQGG